MGTGKTAVGRELARKLRLKLVDIDDLIIQKEERSISDIFSQSGEPYFREVEKEVLAETASQSGQVVSCGGGIVINPDNVAVMKQTGTMIALTSRPEVIFERTKKGTHRPLLNVPDPKAKIKELLTIRKPYYEQAHFVIDTSDVSVQQVAQKILEFIKNKVGANPCVRPLPERQDDD